ncbi:MAG: MFS transporter [Actinomycetota bacterium]|nr:MFS transporter [Actinomycetota bacterium]
MSLADRVQERAEARRWWILAVLCFSLLVIVLDNSILNVALPTIVRELDASNAQLQWIVDSYTIVFAGLLLTAGSLGDRFGRRPALQFGFVVFGLGSAAAALVGSAGGLIATRSVMGVGGAFIMPATLSIITNVFPPWERGRAIGVWAATAGVGVALGPLTGGFLLEHFYWGSIFLVNLPIVVVGLVAGVFLIPDSKDPTGAPLDVGGAALSIAGLGALLFALIEAPEQGWTDPLTLGGFAIGALLLLGFAWWERRCEHPMLDVSFFANPRFSAASAAVTLTFFAMFGSLFVLTQYLQFILGYSALETGVRLLTFAIPMMILAPSSSRFVEVVGTKAVVATGMSLAATGFVLLSFVDATTSFASLSWRLVTLASGMGLTMAPATESIMGSLPRGKAGVGSAVNDTTRQVGGALGVAVIGSVFASIYRSGITDDVGRDALPPGLRDEAADSLGAALAIAGQLGADGLGLATAARDAFIDGMRAGRWIGAFVVAVGVVVTLLFLPAHGRDVDEPALDAGPGDRPGTPAGTTPN